MGEGLSRDGFGAECDRFATISPVADALYDGDLREYGNAKLFGQSCGTFAPENVVTIVGQFGGREPCHVFYEAEDGNVDFLVAIHIDSLAGIGKCHFLWGAYDDSSRDGERLQEGEMNIARARRRVDDEIVEFAPIGIGNELFERVRSHGSAPKGGGLRIDKEADGEEFHAIFERGDEKLAAFDDVCIDGFVF